MLPILRIFDFDETLTINHTAQHPENYKPESNLKDIPMNLRIHTDETFCAIATFNKNPDYILTYMLQFLGYSNEDINKTETIKYNTYQLTKYYFNQCSQPLIIATPSLENYNKNVKDLAYNGKLLMLNTIKQTLPPCVEYHFYENDDNLLGNLFPIAKHFHCHLVKKEPSFNFNEYYKPAAADALKVRLNAYSLSLKPAQDDNKSVYDSLNALSFLSASAELNPKLTIITKLIRLLDRKITIEPEELKILEKDEIINDWEKNYQSLTSLVIKLNRERGLRYSPSQEPGQDFLNQISNSF